MNLIFGIGFAEVKMPRPCTWHNRGTTNSKVTTRYGCVFGGAPSDHSQPPLRGLGHPGVFSLVIPGVTNAQDASFRHAHAFLLVRHQDRVDYVNHTV